MDGDMHFTGEFSLGAVGIIVSIVATGITGIAALLTIWFRTRQDINTLQLQHADLRTDVVEVKGDVKALASVMQTQTIMLERVAARQEVMGAISNLPNDLASAISKLDRN